MIAKLGGLLPLCVDADDTAQSASQAHNTVVEVFVVAKTGKGNQDIADIAEKLLLGGSALTGNELVHAAMRKAIPNTYIEMVLLSTTPSPSFRSTFDARALSWRRVYSWPRMLNVIPTAQDR